MGDLAALLMVGLACVVLLLAYGPDPELSCWGD